MCDFVSWCTHKGTVYFLDDEKLSSRRGEELQAFDPIPENWRGHGAICWFYGFKRSQCKQEECTDFSSPENFPPQVAEAIRACKFTALGVPRSPEQLLNPGALAEYRRIQDPAWAEYLEIEAPAWAEYLKIEGLALAEYRKTQGSALAEYRKTQGSALAEYRKTQDTAWAEYLKTKDAAWAESLKTKDAAWAEYEEIRGSALAEYLKTRGKAFWTLFANPENRTEIWR